MAHGLPCATNVLRRLCWRNQNTRTRHAQITPLGARTAYVVDSQDRRNITHDSVDTQTRPSFRYRWAFRNAHCTAPPPRFQCLRRHCILLFHQCGGGCFVCWQKTAVGITDTCTAHVPCRQLSATQICFAPSSRNCTRQLIATPLSDVRWALHWPTPLNRFERHSL